MDNYTSNDDLAMAMALAQINLQQQQQNEQQQYQFHQQQSGQRHGYQPQGQQRPQFQPRSQQQFQQRPRQQQYYQPPHRQQHYQPRQQHSNNSRHQFQHYPRHQQQFQEQQYLEDMQGDPSVERVLTTITDIIAHLTTSPGDFHSSVRKAVRVLQESLYDADTLGIIITLIVEQVRTLLFVSLFQDQDPICLANTLFVNP